MRTRLFPSLALGLALALTSLSGCAYKSSYRQSNFKHNGAKVPAKQVRVVKSQDDLVSKWTELGTYRGRAPTLQEAMDTAKTYCGGEGGNLFVLDTEPYEGSGWNVSGICGASEKSAAKGKRRKGGKPIR